MPAPTQETTIVSDGLSLLTSHFADKANIQGILSALLAEVQTLENALFDFILKVQLASHPLAGGPWDILDKLGALVGESRMGRSDADYLPAIKIRIRANRSQGLAEDLIQITALLFTGALYREFYPDVFDLYPASFVVQVAGSQAYNNASAVAALASFLTEARKAGFAGSVRAPATSDTVLVWSDPYGGSVSTPGWPDPYGSSITGSWAYATQV